MTKRGHEFLLAGGLLLAGGGLLPGHEGELPPKPAKVAGAPKRERAVPLPVENETTADYVTFWENRLLHPAGKKLDIAIRGERAVFAEGGIDEELARVASASVRDIISAMLADPRAPISLKTATVYRAAADFKSKMIKIEAVEENFPKEQVVAQVRRAIEDLQAYFKDAHLPSVLVELDFDPSSADLSTNRNIVKFGGDNTVSVFVVQEASTEYQYDLKLAGAGHTLDERDRRITAKDFEGGGAAHLTSRLMYDDSGRLLGVEPRRKPLLINLGSIARRNGGDPILVLQEVIPAEILHTLLQADSQAQTMDGIRRGHYAKTDKNPARELFAKVAARQEAVVHAAMVIWFKDYARRFGLQDWQEIVKSNHPGVDEMLAKVPQNQVGAIKLIRIYQERPEEIDAVLATLK